MLEIDAHVLAANIQSYHFFHGVHYSADDCFSSTEELTCWAKRERNENTSLLYDLTTLSKLEREKT